MVGSRSCAACDEINDTNAKFCRKCGADLTETSYQWAAGGGFDVWWMLGGVAVMFGVQTGAGILLGLMGISRLGTLPLVLIALVAFALGGFLVGRFSKGKTILEPAVSAVIAVALAMFVKGHFNLLAIVIGGILPFLAALAGGWLGEKAQGTI